MSLLETYYARH